MAFKISADDSLQQSEWFIAKKTSSSELSILDSAFKDAKSQIVGSPDLRSETEAILKSENSVQDVHKALEKCMAHYEGQLKATKVLRWLRKLSEKMMAYEGVVDTVIQQHPESVALIWGTMKLLLLGVINHEKTVKGLAKALANIGAELPRVGLLAELYPTDRMKKSAAELVANILEFLTRAHTWYTEGKFKRALHGFTQPFDLRYGDILDNIARTATVIGQLADCGFLVEFRDFKTTVVSELQGVRVAMSAQHAEAKAFRSLILSTTIDTNNRVTDLQFSQISQALARATTIWGPDTVLAYLQANRKRSSLKQARLLAQTFWELPSMRKWTLSKTSDIFIIKGTRKTRQALQSFCVDVVEQLHASSIPVILALATSQEGAAAHSMSTIELLKYLVHQLLGLCRAAQTEKSMSISAAAFSGDLDAKQWFGLVKHLLLQIPGCVYFVVDLGLLKREGEKPCDFDWLPAFQGLLKSLESRQPLTAVKVLLMAYSSELSFHASQSESSMPSNSDRTSVARVKKGKGPIRDTRSQGRKARFFKNVSTH